MNLLDLAVHNLVRRPARSALTIAAVALGIAATVSLTSIAWGFEASWQNANDARGTDLIVTRVASENAMPSPFVAADNVRTLKRMPHVADVVGLLSEMLSVSESAPPVFVFGWEYKGYLWDHLRLLRGRWPTADGEQAIVLGTIASELLHRDVGDRLEIEGRPFQVTGVYESPAVIENGALIITLTQAQVVTDKPGKVNVLNIKLDGEASPRDIDAIKASVRATMPGFVAITSGELVRQNTIVRIAKAMSRATSLISCLVGALVVFNSMLMSVNERTREIGVLQAIGWQRSTIQRLIVCEAMILTCTGGAIGIAMGLLITVGLEHMELMRGKIDAVFSLPFYLGVLVLSVLLGVAGGLFPAIKASRMRPARALRADG
jgi:putative ABC transport system permease protein